MRGRVLIIGCGAASMLMSCGVLKKTHELDVVVVADTNEWMRQAERTSYQKDIFKGDTLEGFMPLFPDIIVYVESSGQRLELKQTGNGIMYKAVSKAKASETFTHEKEVEQEKEASITTQTTEKATTKRKRAPPWLGLVSLIMIVIGGGGLLALKFKLF